MDEAKFSQLTRLLDRVSTEPSTRESFLEDPLRTVSTSLNLPAAPTSVEPDLANALVLSVLRSPEALSALKEVNAKRDAAELDDLAAKQETAKVVLAAAPAELQTRLLKLWGDKQPHLPGFDPKPALANLIVHVDVVAVVTKAAVVHEDYVFNGSGVPDITDLQKVANALAHGQ